MFKRSCSKLCILARGFSLTCGPTRVLELVEPDVGSLDDAETTDGDATVVVDGTSNVFDVTLDVDGVSRTFWLTC